MTDVYVYYRVSPADTHMLRPQVQALQSAMVQEHGVCTALKRRPEEKDGLQTWMEIYYAVPDGFATTLAQAASQLALPGERHIEIFVDIPECA